MLKKFLVIVLAVFASTRIMAAPENIKMMQLDPQKASPWSFEDSTWHDAFIAPSALTPVIFYVSKFRTSNPRLLSDPVLLDCSGVPTFIQPGHSAVCEIGPHESGKIGTAEWGIASSYYHNGSEGYTIMLQEWSK